MSQKSQRTTIMLDADIAKKVRQLQAQRIKEKLDQQSFSGTINEIIRQYFEKK